MIETKLYKEKDVCELLDVSPHVLRRQVKLGNISAIKIGRCIRYPSDSVRDFIQSNYYRGA